MYVYIYIFRYIYIYVYICIYICMYIYTCIYINVCIYMYIYTCMYINVYIYIYMYVYINICIRIYLYIHLYTYVYIYIYIAEWHVQWQAAPARGWAPTEGDEERGRVVSMMEMAIGGDGHTMDNVYIYIYTCIYVYIARALQPIPSHSCHSSIDTFNDTCNVRIPPWIDQGCSVLGWGCGRYFHRQNPVISNRLNFREHEKKL